MQRVASAAVAVLVTVSLACASDRAAGPTAATPPGPDEAPSAWEQERAFRAALLALPDEAPQNGDEPFAAYLERAKASLARHPDAEVREIARSLPVDVRDVLAAPHMRVGSLLLGTWARTRQREARVEALTSLIRHPTVNPPDVEVPGRTPAFDAFEADLKARAEGLGLRFDHVEHVAYEVSFGDGARSVGALVHGDVVPASEPGWSVDPFAGVVQGGKVLGRGALDDKGPLIAVLYAIDALAKSGVSLDHRVLLVVGTSEETHWQGIARYQEARGLPDALFVADGAFPVGVGEKGITTVRVSAKIGALGVGSSVRKPSAMLLSLEGGEVANQVPASARATLAPAVGHLEDLATRLSRRAAERSDMRLQVRREGEHVVVEAAGEAAHGAVPAEGHNALADLVRFLTQDAELVSLPGVALLAVLDEKLGTGVSGDGLGVDDAHPRFTPATVNLGTARTSDDGVLTLALNIRWPPPRSEEEVVASVRRALEEALADKRGGPYPIELEHGGLDPFLAPEDGPLVRALVDAYEQVTGEDGTPVTLSGTTYAKAAPGSVTFGPGRPGGGARIHAADEHITLEELDELTELYTIALARLARSELTKAAPTR